MTKESKRRKRKGSKGRKGKGHIIIYKCAREGKGGRDGLRAVPICRRRREHKEATGYGEDTGESTGKKGKVRREKGHYTTCAHFIL